MFTTMKKTYYRVDSFILFFCLCLHQAFVNTACLPGRKAVECPVHNVFRGEKLFIQCVNCFSFFFFTCKSSEMHAH